MGRSNSTALELWIYILCSRFTGLTNIDYIVLEWLIFFQPCQRFGTMEQLCFVRDLYGNAKDLLTVRG